MSIFPSEVIGDLIQTTVVEAADLPLAKEYAWDFTTNDFIFVNGKNVVVTGKSAVKVWVWKALQTAKRQCRAYSSGFGNDLELLISQGLSKAAMESELERYVRESMQMNPYILGISNVISTVEGSQAEFTFTVDTLYGEAVVSV